MDRRQQSESLFEAAADLPPDARKTFLDNACGGDADLRREADDLLAADGKAGAGIFAAVEDAAQSLFAIESVASGRIGAYRVVSEIGRGGMSTVYLGRTRRRSIPKTGGHQADPPRHG
jgi:eukaryotic-like serine/threonine-protein kinase